jgi:hypothetical protein
LNWVACCCLFAIWSGWERECDAVVVGCLLSDGCLTQLAAFHVLCYRAGPGIAG